MIEIILFRLFTLSKIVLYYAEAHKKRLFNTSGSVIRVEKMPRKTIYGKCPKCKTKSELEVISGNPGREKFRCNQCYHKFGMDEL